VKCGVVVFPGSNCDHDVYHVWKHVLGEPATFLWHHEPTVQDCDLVVLPGGFSYGDYLRAGAMAAQSPILGAVRRHAESGGLVLGVCNGFQVLVESGLLPGVLRKNIGLRFLSQDVHLRVERADLPFTNALREGEVLRMPIAHGMGNFYAPDEMLDELEANRQVAFRYCAPDGKVDPDDAESNPNGSVRAIAGICNRGGNVLGLMPHPERCAEAILGNEDGLGLFRSAVVALAASATPADHRAAAGGHR
jgi:phosphoribosylformylglycinamidine synthase I